MLSRFGPSDMDRETLVRETAAIVGWLERHPEERTLILWQALSEREDPEPSIGFEGVSAAGALTLASHRDHIQRFMAAASFGPCAVCYLPAVYLPDLTVLEYPAMVRHECASAPVAQLAEQRFRRPQVAGSSPAGGSTPPQRKPRLLD